VKILFETVFSPQIIIFISKLKMYIKRK